MKYICNAFSLQMLQGVGLANLTIRRILSPRIILVMGLRKGVVKACIGHADTAAVIGSYLGVEIPVNRESITLESGDVLYVAQLQGGRLPEGTKTLPEGFKFVWYAVTYQEVA